MIKNWFFYLILAITFLVGGAIQLVGLASNSLLTIATTVLIACHLLYTLFIRRKVVKLKLLPFAILVTIIVVSAMYNAVSLSLTVLYIWMFLGVPFTIYYLIKYYLPKIDTRELINFFLFVAVIQMPIIIIQTEFYSVLAPLASRDIAKIDFSFGTFFLANDHALGFLILSITIVLLYTDYKPPYFNRFVYILWFVVTVIICDSKISFILLGGLAFVYLVTHITSKMILAITMVAFLSPLMLLFIPNSLKYIEEKSSYILSKISPDESVEQYTLERAIELGNAERSQIFTYYTSEPVKITGEGPYNYWNPITKKFSIFPNYSQLLWFYNDLGFFSLLALIFFYSFYYFRNNPTLSFKVIYLVFMLVYTYFTNTLSDLAFNLIFFTFILVNWSRFRVKTKNKQHEFSTHTLS